MELGWFYGAVSLIRVSSDVDNARFKTTATHEGDKDALLAAIMDLDNWEFDNGSAYGSFSDGIYSRCRKFSSGTG